MYQPDIHLTLLISITIVINMIRGNTFNVFTIPLEKVNSTTYCELLDEKLRENQSSVLLLEIGRVSQIYEVVASERGKICDQTFGYDQEIPMSNVTDTLIQMIHDRKVSVQSHRIVDHITLHTTAYEIQLTVERAGELEPSDVKSRAGGVANNENLLLSLIGGGRIKSFVRQKNP
ncbi:uncharacterized protein LOC131285004 [Anopheles ziemanni]|uniref:uncharacterized protein LOC131262866 n=1 Tax=Anopheles coustani TaxID=139045 RepID=UPI002657E783|nr:uncharacterized protein LOC131262866 [Anopheles coustani]XP_058169848.1 uncharacterized protein LOC131285004 [Anopheles ziemanni]